MTQRVTFDAPSLSVGFDLNGEGRNLKTGTLIDGAAFRYIRKEGFVMGTCGYRSIATLGTAKKVDSMFGASAALTKSLWVKSDTSMFHTLEDEGKKYTIGVSLTSTEKNFLLEGRNGDIFTFNQIDSPLRIASARLTVDTDDSSGVLTVGTGMIDKFSATGTVYVRGSPVTYSGKSGGTLTGLSGIPSGGVKTGDLLTQTSTPSTFSIAKGTCGMIIEGSMLVGGALGYENVIYQSAPSNDDNPEFLWDFNDNGANATVLDNPMTAMIRGTKFGYVLGESFILSVAGYDIVTNILQIDDVTTGFGAYNQNCVANVGGRMLAFGKNRLIPTSLFLSGQASIQANIDENFDTPVRPWLEQMDTTGQDESAFLSYNPSTGLLTVGGKIDGQLRVRRFDARDGVKLFTPEDQRPARVYTHFDGNSYFGANSTSGKVYIDNDSLTNDGFPILHQARTSRMEAGREVLLDVLKIDGFMSMGCEHTLSIYVDGMFDAPIYSIVIDDSFIISTQGQPQGNRTRGSFVPGGDVTEDIQLKFPFRADIDLTGLSGEDFSIDWLMSTLAGFLQIKSFILEGDGIRFRSTDRY